MKLTQAYAVGNELFRTYQEALAREREIALKEVMNGLDTLGFIRKFCSDEEFRKRVQIVSDMGIVADATEIKIKMGG